ncbi:MAG: ABC transporter permease subunit [Treponema sp.]|jgi:ABC-2 type transport system permease protein|nr:ABC transporter permease subunit [Treponema sp.]
MKQAYILAKRELYSLCISPVLYGTAIFFLIFLSLWFYSFQHFFTLNSATFRPFFAAFPLVFILVIPVITMKVWAEERKVGTLEILLTMPFSEWDLVLGKFISSFAVVFMLVILSIPVPLSIIPLGDFDGGIIFSEYFGTLLLGASATALGLLFSSLAKNQGGAFLGSVTVLLVVMLIQQLSQNVPPVLAHIFNFFSLSFHFESFSKGILDSRDLCFFLLSTIFFLFLNTRVIIFRKWGN